VVLTVSDGMLLMFPSYLAHSVAPNKSDKLRISISFNLKFF
jgi:ectoine hydroxylase-related dioxygenase (phytanoyl-CoA dioxygenase family)